VTFSSFASLLPPRNQTYLPRRRRRPVLCRRARSRSQTVSASIIKSWGIYQRSDPKGHISASENGALGWAGVSPLLLHRISATSVMTSRAKPVPGTDRIRLKFEPLTVDWTGEGTRVAAPEPTFPPPQVVGEGEEIVMDLAFNTADGQKITEHLSAHIGPPKPLAEPRDLTLDEVDLHLSLPTLFVDDQIVRVSLRCNACLWSVL